MSSLKECFKTLDKNEYFYATSSSMLWVWIIIAILLLCVIICAAGWGEEIRMRERDNTERDNTERDSTERDNTENNTENNTDDFMYGAVLDIGNDMITLPDGELLKAVKKYHTLSMGKWSFNYKRKPYEINIDTRDEIGDLVDENLNRIKYFLMVDGDKIEFY